MRYLLILLLTGCTTIETSVKPPADWPAMKMETRAPGFMKLQEKCGISPLAIALIQCYGITEVNFCERRCIVSLTETTKQATYSHAETLALCKNGTGTLSHEACHCLGYDHPQTTYFKDQWKDYKKMDYPIACRMRMGDENYLKLWPEHKVMPERQ